MTRLRTLATLIAVASLTACTDYATFVTATTIGINADVTPLVVASTGLLSGAVAGSMLGFGMGLFVAKSYLERMRGRIHAENHPEGGARFICILPEWREAEREAQLVSR